MGTTKKTGSDQAFDTDIGQKASVEHHVYENDPRMNELRAVLKDIALDMQQTGRAPKDYRYMGSLSVHIYGAEGLKGNYAFAGLTHLEDCKYKVAEAGLMKLREDVEFHFTGKRRKKRSGF